MVSISSETNGLMKQCELVQVNSKRSTASVILNVWWTFRSTSCGFFLCPADVFELEYVSRDPRPSPCQGAGQEVLEEVLFCVEAVWAVLLQQGDFQGQWKCFLIESTVLSQTKAD